MESDNKFWCFLGQREQENSIKVKANVSDKVWKTFGRPPYFFDQSGFLHIPSSLDEL